MKNVLILFVVFSFSASAQDLWSYCSQAANSISDLSQTFIGTLYNNVQTVLSGEENLKAEAKKAHLEHCIQKNEKGCLYKRKYLTNYFSYTLIIYFRGHWAAYGGVVPKDARSASIEQVISAYGLDKTYEKQQDPMLISPSSDVAYTVDDIKNAIKAASLPENAFVILAAHSGGNVGLLQTLKNLTNQDYKFSIQKISMLDNFYFDSKSTAIIKQFIIQGAECNGFLTLHNEERYKERFLKEIPPSDCNIDFKENHNTTVNKCLLQYISKNSCDIKI
jgi:hypothetical protein